ncbi:MAG: hypothetical protein JKY65_32565 [Planctomycetes bacterium]|nr:hypothetical protein [Planctomycetota bacterium]
MRIAALPLVLLLLSAWATPGLAQQPTPTPLGSAAAAIPSIEEATGEEPESFSIHYGNNIRIEGTKEYVIATTALLDQFAALPTGAQILEALGETGRQTTIVKIPEGSGPSARPLDPENAVPKADGTPGSGSDGLLMMDPDFVLDGFSPPVVMGHEILHVLHYQLGERKLARMQTGRNRGTSLEELVTIGTDEFEDDLLTENALRVEWNAANPDDPIPPARYGHGARDFTPPAEDTTQQTNQGVTPTDSELFAPGSESYEGGNAVLKRALGGEK